MTTSFSQLDELYDKMVVALPGAELTAVTTKMCNLLDEIMSEYKWYCSKCNGNLQDESVIKAATGASICSICHGPATLRA